MKRKLGLCLLVFLILSIVISLSSCDLTNRNKDKCTHDYTDWEITKSATCVTEGVRQRECRLCGATEEAKVEKNASHDYGEFVLVEENNCLRTGKAIRTCKICGAEDQTYVLGDHKPGAWVGSKEPTFLEDGCVEHSVCTACGKSIDRALRVIDNAIIPKLSSNLSICLNGEIVAPLRIESGDTYSIKLLSDPINVNAGDVVTICQTDNPSVKYEYTVTFNSSIPDLPVKVYGNINEDGTVRTTSSSVVSMYISDTKISLSMGGYRPESGVVAVVTHSSFDQTVMIPLEKMAYPDDPDKQAYIFGLFEADERLSVESISILDLDSGKTYGFADLDMAWNTWSFGRGSSGEIMFKDNEADWWLAFDVGGNKKIELHKLTKPAANTSTSMVFPNGDKFSLDKVTLDKDDDKYLYYTFPALDTHLGNRSEYSKYVSGTTLDIERIEINADAGAKFYLSNSRDSSMAHENLAWVNAPAGAITVDTRNGYIEINTKGKYIIDYLPYSMSIFIYYVEEAPKPDPDPTPDPEGIVIEINGIGAQMNFVTYTSDESTSYVYGYAYINAGDKLLIRDTESGAVWGYEDIDAELLWNTWDYHKGEGGEIVFDFTARYAFEFDRNGNKLIYITKVFAPNHGESFGIDFEGEREDVTFDSFDLSDSADSESEFVDTLTNETTLNNSDFIEYIDESGLWFYYIIIDLEAGEKFSLKNLTTGGTIGADSLADITGDITAVTRDGDLVEVLKSGSFYIIYLPAFNTFTIECDTTDPLSEIYIYTDEELTLTPDENGDVFYNGLSVTASSCIMIFDARNSPLPIILDDAMDKSLVDVTVYGDYYYAYTNKAGTCNLKYNVYTGILYLEYVGGEEEEPSLPYKIYITYDNKLDLTVNPDNSDEMCYLGLTMGAWDEFKVWDTDNNYIADMTLATGTTGIVTDGRIITFQTAGTYDFYINKTTHEVRFVAASGGEGGGDDIGGDDPIISDKYIIYHEGSFINVNSEGNIVKYTGLVVSAGDSLSIMDSDYEDLPVNFDPSVDTSLAKLHSAYNMVSFVWNCKADLTYNVETGVLSLNIYDVNYADALVYLMHSSTYEEIYSDEDGIITKRFEFTESSNVCVCNSSFEALPMILHEGSDSSLLTVMTYKDGNMLYIPNAGVYDFTYDLNSKIFTFEAVTEA